MAVIRFDESRRAQQVEVTILKIDYHPMPRAMDLTVVYQIVVSVGDILRIRSHRIIFCELHQNPNRLGLRVRDSRHFITHRS